MTARHMTYNDPPLDDLFECRREDMRRRDLLSQRPRLTMGSVGDEGSYQGF
jgi:hypothetical protein